MQKFLGSSSIKQKWEKIEKMIFTIKPYFLKLNLNFILFQLSFEVNYTNET